MSKPKTVIANAFPNLGQMVQQIMGASGVILQLPMAASGGAFTMTGLREGCDCGWADCKITTPVADTHPVARLVQEVRKMLNKRQRAHISVSRFYQAVYEKHRQVVGKVLERFGVPSALGVAKHLVGMEGWTIPTVGYDGDEMAVTIQHPGWTFRRVHEHTEGAFWAVLEAWVLTGVTVQEVKDGTAWQKVPRKLRGVLFPDNPEYIFDDGRIGSALKPLERRKR